MFYKPYTEPIYIYNPPGAMTYYKAEFYNLFNTVVHVPDNFD